jgi:16S rRNA G1207 methylase RsmC
MAGKISKRLLGIIETLPLKEGIRVLEIGCGPGVIAREISRRFGNGRILVIDHFAKAIQPAIKGSQAEIATGRLSFRQIAIEHFKMDAIEKKLDLAIAVSVGTLDGRHPELKKQALIKIATALTKEGRLFIDSGNYHVKNK